MAAVEQGAPLTPIDYDFWVNLPERQSVRLLQIVRNQGGTILARTLYELENGTQVKAVFAPSGLRAFRTELRSCEHRLIEGVRISILPLNRVIASKTAAGRDKDLAVLPVLKRTLRLSRRFNSRRK